MVAGGRVAAADATRVDDGGDRWCGGPAAVFRQAAGGVAVRWWVGGGPVTGWWSGGGLWCGGPATSWRGLDPKFPCLSLVSSSSHLEDLTSTRRIPVTVVVIRFSPYQEEGYLV
ncbi:hypothetical protein Q3G72_017194 [Acer saccharum]|nr:hypothetical protein Q3G72_017194 [Acer saccharum]